MTSRIILSLLLFLVASPGIVAKSESGQTAENDKTEIEREKIKALENEKTKIETKISAAINSPVLEKILASENNKAKVENEKIIAEKAKSSSTVAPEIEKIDSGKTKATLKAGKTTIKTVKLTTESGKTKTEAEKAASEKVANEKAENEKATTEQTAIEKAIIENSTTEKAATEKAKTEQTTTEKETAEKITTEQTAAEKAITEKAITEQTATENGKKTIENEKTTPEDNKVNMPENKKLILHGGDIVSYPIPCPIKSKDQSGIYPKACPCEDLLNIYCLAADYDPTLQAARAQQLATREAYPQARAQMLPLINASADYTTNNYTIPNLEHFFTTSNYSLTLAQPIMHFEQWANLDKASDTVKQANATYCAAEQDLMIRTAEAYFNVLKATDSLYFAEAQEKAFLKFQDQTYQRFKVGLIPITDYEIAKARHDSALALVISSQTELQDNVDKLREIICIRPHKLAPLKKEIPLLSPQPQNMEEWVEVAINQNFTLLAAYYNAEAARNNIRVNKYQHLPVIDVHGEFDTNSANPLISPTGYRAGILGARITLPLIAGGSILSKTREARFNYQKADSQFEIEFRTVESATRQAYRGVITQIDQIRALKQALVSNQSALDATQASFNVGTRTIVDVLNAQSDLIRAQKDYSDARNNYVLEILKLKQAAGTLCIEDIYIINEWLQCTT